VPRVRPLDACPVCGSPASSEAFVAPDFLLGVPGEYRYVRCGECESVYQNPRVEEEDLPICYSSDYFTHHVGGAELSQGAVPGDSVRGRLRSAVLHAADGRPAPGVGLGLRGAGWLMARLPSLRRRARFGLPDPLGTTGAEGRCLEVGPGRGFDLLQLERIGWRAHGLEMDPEAAANARRVSGCEIRVGTLLTTDYPPASFQLVYMSHVLEHLPQLERSLRRCFELLAPGGRLFAAYPIRARSAPRSTGAIPACGIPRGTSPCRRRGGSSISCGAWASSRRGPGRAPCVRRPIAARACATRGESVGSRPPGPAPRTAFSPLSNARW